MTKDDPVNTGPNAGAEVTTDTPYETLAQCSAMVEATAFQLAGTIEASLVARLISVAAVLQRLSEEVRTASGD